MRLAEFITSDMERILQDWEAFAAEQTPAATAMSPKMLRDHARQMLNAIVKDLSTSQSRTAEIAKSEGRAPVLHGSPETAAETHGMLRAESGFDLNQMASEYRALRSSVLRLWIDACSGEVDLGDVIRFNEAIDQALAESIAFFQERVEEARNLFLGMLGHDMRTPLQAILMTARYLEELKTGGVVSEAARRLMRSGQRMQALLNDLVAFNRTQLGLGITISPTHIDAAPLFEEELEQVKASCPGRELAMSVTGPTEGFWDGLCLQRLLDNLLVNAIKYGKPGTPIQIDLRGDGETLLFEVKNDGPTIDEAGLSGLFDPLRRGGLLAQNGGERSSLGLGLYIAREIAKAHGGEIAARSHAGETVFSVSLPRHASPAGK